jgi:hypothetical protein
MMWTVAVCFYYSPRKMTDPIMTANKIMASSWAKGTAHNDQSTAATSTRLPMITLP